MNAHQRLVTILAATAPATVNEARAAGYQCGRDGAGMNNCALRFFATPELTRAWEEGKRAAEAEKKPHRGKRGAT